MPDVIVAGAGPVGLTVAGDLAAAGFDVAVLERRQGEHDPNVTRAFVVHARTLELLDVRGLADTVIGSRAGWITGFSPYRGVTIDMSRVPSRFNGLLITPQYNVDGALRDRACRLGVAILHGTEVVGVQQDDGGVAVTARTDAGELTYRAKYLVGADGVHSAVRQAAGVAFLGRPFLRSMMLADVRLTDPPPPGRVQGNGVRDGFALLVPYGDGWWRVIAWDRQISQTLADDTPVDLDQIAAVLRRTHGTDFGMHDPRWTSRFDADERLALTYRAGRVLLAGDAAHQHAPAGGQGMNLGIQDAANLSWRLAQVLRGAPERLLDGYTAERRPVAQDVLRSSNLILRVATVSSSLGQALRRPVGRTALGIGPIARRITGQLSGIGVRYPRPRGAHRLVGTRAPDIALRNGTRLYQALRSGWFQLLTPRSNLDGCWGDRIEYVSAAIDGAAALVRPDGYIAWAGAVTAGAEPPEPVLAELLGPR